MFTLNYFQQLSQIVFCHLWFLCFPSNWHDISKCSTNPPKAQNYSISDSQEIGSPFTGNFKQAKQAHYKPQTTKLTKPMGMGMAEEAQYGTEQKGSEKTVIDDWESFTEKEQTEENAAT